MKKSLRKVIVTLSAVAALSLALGATAMAEVTTSEIQEGGKATVTYTATNKTPGEEVTVLLLKPDADKTNGIQQNEIAYIDQKAADVNGEAVFTMPITGVSEGQSYALMSGSASATEVTNDTATFESEEEVIFYGDLNNNKAIEAVDAGYLVKWAAGKIDLDDESYNERMAISVEDYNDAGATDALYIIKWAAGKDTAYNYKFEWELEYLD